ncbi:mechanosensitive ion channel family protein [Cellvibrio sp. NN19]|uniref:mechanosensitive ion channel family protein n=1 Tax=Cellvibrio chitinivorans TaxID=3102792 RepID=UPI002B412565|nr:mechanosensitive ion channel domain-containing protein [Cellvibrio sp. NN19]
MKLGETLKAQLTQWLNAYNLEYSEWIYVAVATGIFILTGLLLHFLLHSVILRAFKKSANKSQLPWGLALFKHKLLNRIALVFQGVVLLVQVRIWLPQEGEITDVLQTLAYLWILFYLLLSLYALLNFIEDILRPASRKRNIPIRGIFQSIKLIAALITIILIISVLIDKSPLILFSGLGAMTAVLSLVFKDTILGFVAGIQLSANDMLAVGDWLEMPKFGADGDVIDISLTTVKVRNWDNTITTIPAYSLIADSFKNWRGMTESGGRRIKRAVYIDATSVKFLQQDDIVRLRRAALLSDYIEKTIAEIETENKQAGVDLTSPVNGRRLTNLGTFRAYLRMYLKQHKSIHNNMTQIVRQLAPEAQGIPLEIYAFSSDTGWVNYEAIQSDIFDHIFAVVPEFGLRIYQAPSGYDMQQISSYRPEKPAEETGTEA